MKTKLSILLLFLLFNNALLGADVSADDQAKLLESTMIKLNRENEAMKDSVASILTPEQMKYLGDNASVFVGGILKKEFPKLKLFNKDSFWSRIKEWLANITGNAKQIEKAKASVLKSLGNLTTTDGDLQIIKDGSPVSVLPLTTAGFLEKFGDSIFESKAKASNEIYDGLASQATVNAQKIQEKIDLLKNKQKDSSKLAEQLKILEDQLIYYEYLLKQYSEQKTKEIQNINEIKDAAKDVAIEERFKIGTKDLAQQRLQQESKTKTAKSSDVYSFTDLSNMSEETKKLLEQSKKTAAQLDANSRTANSVPVKPADIANLEFQRKQLANIQQNISDHENLGKHLVSEHANLIDHTTISHVSAAHVRA